MNYEIDQNKLDLEAIKKREAAASPGPWGYYMLGGGKGGPNRYTVRHSGDDDSKDFAICVCVPRQKADTSEIILSGGWNASFIAHARQDIPILIRKIERLLKEKGAL